MLGRQIAVGFGIAIVFPLLIYYGVSTFHSAPEAYSRSANEFSRVLAFVAIPLGTAAILIGAFLTNAAIGTGLIFGGIFTVVLGYWGYWSHLDDWFRFASLAIGFAVLLFVGFYKLKPPKPPPAA